MAGERAELFAECVSGGEAVDADIEEAAEAAAEDEEAGEYEWSREVKECHGRVPAAGGVRGAAGCGV